MTIRHYMLHIPVNTAGDEKMIVGVRRRLEELVEVDDVELGNLIDIYEKV